MQGVVDQRSELLLGRYAIFDQIAAGGMATVHLGRLLGPAGFSKVVAIKRLHPHLARDPEFSSMFIDEARVAARIQHPNVVSTLDVVPLEDEVFLVLDYVQGEPLSRLIKATEGTGQRIDPRIAATLMVGALHGLHAAHEATDELGHSLNIVHRDVSPQNIMVGTDGVSRVLDFGVAKAAGRLQGTRDGQLKGKIAYMAPEQVRGEEVDRRTDVYSAGVVLWEALTCKRLVSGKNEASVLQAVLSAPVVPPSRENSAVPPALDAVVLRALEKDRRRRFSSARDMAIELERSAGIASSYEVGEWVRSVATETLALRAARVKEMESTSAVRLVGPPTDVMAPPAWERSRSGMSNPWAGASSPTAAQAPPAPPARSHALLVVATVLITAAIGSIALLVFFLTRDKAEAPAPAAAAATAGTPAVASEPEPQTALPPPTPAPEPEATTEEPAVDIDSLPPAEAPKPVTQKPPATPAKPAEKPKPKSCDSPFYIDGEGIKHVKPECL